MVGAVIYVRVSTKEQTENLSLPTQLRACQEYCRRQGYDVLERFHEEGESAKTTDRSQLQALLKYCRTNKGKVHFVVVYNLTRFAREKYDHFALRAHLNSLGISLRSATEPIDDTSTGKLMEGVLAAFAQFDNDVRSERTRAGMRAALELGRWTFPAPLGYLNAPKSSSTSLVFDTERAPLVRRAFEDLATGRYTKQDVIARATEGGLRSRKGLRISPQSLGQMMRNPIYTGKVESPDYGVSVRGDFEPLIDEATFYRAQAVLDGRVVVSGPRRRNHPDFPLRGFVRCEACGRPLTGSWSKGRNGRYAYYHCQKQCRAVNVTKATLEGAFADELALLQPSAGYMRLVNDRILSVWEQRRAEASERTSEQERRVKAVQQKLDRLDDAFLFAQSIDRTSYERQRDRLREELTLAQIDHHAEAVDELDVQGKVSDCTRAGIELTADATQFVICEAKMFSRLSRGTTRVPDYNQAARSVGCMASALSKARRPLTLYRSLGFFVLAPERQITDGVFAREMTRDALRTGIKDRVSLYNEQERADALEPWLRSWALPLLEPESPFTFDCVSWESVIDRIATQDADSGDHLSAFYADCLRYNASAAFAPDVPELITTGSQ